VNSIELGTATNRFSRCCGIVILLLVATTGWAQQPVEDTPAGEPEVPVASGTEAATSAETGTPASAEPAGSEPPTGTDSPFDYRASEKISEDLSVSFPVDI
jgi:hypothetical protein